MATFVHSTWKDSAVSGLEHLLEKLAEMGYQAEYGVRALENECKADEQRKAAQQLFSKVMDAGAEKHGIQWLAFHMAIHDLVDQEYLPEAPNGDSDPRVRALIAEIADAVLSKYKLVPR